MGRARAATAAVCGWALVAAWARLHGLVSLELAGQLATIPVDVDLMYGDLVEQVLALPLPPTR